MYRIELGVPALVINIAGVKGEGAWDHTYDVNIVRAAAKKISANGQARRLWGGGLKAGPLRREELFLRLPAPYKKERKKGGYNMNKSKKKGNVCI